LLTAGGGAGGASGGSTTPTAAMTANFFTTAGFFQSVAGEIGVRSTNSPSATTFLSGGGGTGNQSANYGYNNGVSDGGAGYFQMSPIIVGVGGNGNTGGTGAGKQKGGIGCGGAGSSSVIATPFSGSAGGDGLAVIITW